MMSVSAPTIRPSSRATNTSDDSACTRSWISDSSGGGLEVESCGISRWNASTSSAVTSSATSTTTSRLTRARSYRLASSGRRRDGGATVWCRHGGHINAQHQRTDARCPCSSPSPARCTSRPSATPAYAALGLRPEPGDVGGVAMPDGPAYFCSRGSVIGQVPGEVVAAAFGVFNPAVVVPAVADRLDAAPTRRRSARPARAAPSASSSASSATSPTGSTGPTELLDRAVEPLRPEGRPLFAGLRSLGAARTTRSATCGAWPTCCASTAATPTSRPGRAAGFDATEIGLLTELYWGLPMRTLRPHAGVERRRLRRGRGAAARRAGCSTRRRRSPRRAAPRARQVEVRTDGRWPADHRRARRRPRRAGRHPRAVGRGGPRRPAATRPSGPHDLARAVAR